MKNVRYNQSDEIIEVIIRDASGQKMQVWRNNISDAKRNGNLLKTLMKKWGMKFELEKGFLDLETEILKF